MELPDDKLSDSEVVNARPNLFFDIVRDGVPCESTNVVKAKRVQCDYAVTRCV